MTTRDRVTGLSMEVSRGLQVLELGNVQDSTGTALVEQGGTAPHSESVWAQPSNHKCNQIGKGLIQPDNTENGKLGVSVVPPEPAGQNSVLHDALVDDVSWQCDKNVFSRSDVYRSDKCTILTNEYQVPLVPPEAADMEIWNAHG